MTLKFNACHPGELTMIPTHIQASVLPRPGEDATRHPIAQAAKRFRRYRLARDRAQLRGRAAEPHLYQLIAGLLEPQT